MKIHQLRARTKDILYEIPEYNYATLPLDTILSILLTKAGVEVGDLRDLFEAVELEDKEAIEEVWGRLTT